MRAYARACVRTLVHAWMCVCVSEGIYILTVARTDTEKFWSTFTSKHVDRWCCLFSPVQSLPQQELCTCVGAVRLDQQGVGGGPRAAGVVTAYCVCTGSEPAAASPPGAVLDYWTNRRGMWCND